MRNIIHCDLTHVVMVPFQLALNIAKEINDELYQQIFKKICQPIVKKHAGSNYEYWIDYDSIGNVARLKAYELFSLLAIELKSKSLTLDVHYCHDTLSEDNKVLLEYIADNLSNVLIKETIVIKPREYIDYFSALNESVDEIYAGNKSANFFYQQNICPDKHSEQIIQYAWMVTHYDAIELAKNIFNKGYQLAKDIKNKLQYLLCLQVARVGLQQYDEVMAETYPEIVKNSPFKEAFLYSKAYAGVLSRRFDEVGQYFDALNVDEMHKVDSIESLYRLNIYALYLFHQGKRKTALHVEQLIHDNLQQFNKQNTMFIEYINSLNLSRVYRANKDFVVAKQYCDRAYASIYGLKTDSDHVYHNINDGLLHESLAEYELAFYAWLRAALHWQAMPCQSALAWRPQAALMGRDFNFNQAVDVSRIKKIFYEKLVALANKASILVSEPKLRSLRFQYLQSTDNVAGLNYIGRTGLSCLLSNTKTTKLEADELNSLLCNLVSKLCKVDIPHEAVILIDGNRGFGMITNENDLQARCFALGITQYTFSGIKKLLPKHLNNELQLSISPAVYKLAIDNDRHLIQFKRYHADVPLNDKEAKLIDLLVAKGTVSLNKFKTIIDQAMIKNLYMNNVVCLQI